MSANIEFVSQPRTIAASISASIFAFAAFVLMPIAQSEPNATCADGTPKEFGECPNDRPRLETPSQGVQQQNLGPLKVTLLGVDGGAGHITVRFTVVNTGIQEVRLGFFGHGSYGNGGSTIIAKGQEILASTIEVGGQVTTVHTNNTFIPGVTLSGRVEFDGVYVNPGDVQVFQLAYSQANLRPQGRVRFSLSGAQPAS